MTRKLFFIFLSIFILGSCLTPDDIQLDEAEKTIDAISDEVDSAMPAVLGGEVGLV